MKEQEKVSEFGNNPIRCRVPFNEDGCHFGELELVSSNVEYDYGVIPIPIVVMKNGEGPTVFISAGCHGDEYEGQIVLRDLISTLKPEDISGRLIILPALNYPAVRAGTRTSPLDDGNLNRSFPGVTDQGPTSALAHYISHTILPMCDVGIDLHSGGRAIEFLPSGFVCTAENPEVFKESLELSRCFTTDHVVVCDGGSPPTGLDGAAHALGMPFVSAELGGGGVAATKMVEDGIKSVQNMLQYLGVIEGPPDLAADHCYVDLVADYAHCAASREGVFRTFVDVGDKVEAGQLLAQLYPLDEVEAEPLKILSPITGVVIMRRSLCRAKKGQYVFTVAAVHDRESIVRIAQPYE